MSIVNNRIALDAVKRGQQAWAELQERPIASRELAAPLVAEMRNLQRLIEERIAELQSRVWWLMISKILFAALFKLLDGICRHALHVL